MSTEAPINKELGAKLLAATEAERAAALAGGKELVGQGAVLAGQAKESVLAYASGTRSARADVMRSKLACEQYIKELQEKDTQGKAVEAFSLFFKYVAKPLLFLLVIWIKVARVGYKIFQVLPLNIIRIIVGVCLCFFGGTFFASIAVIEAIRQFGGDLFLDQLGVLWEEGERAEAALEQDLEIDTNKDGIKDVAQMNYSEFITHETAVVMAAVKDPTALTKAMSYLLTMWISVIAVVSCEFAKTVALCLGIVEILELPVVRVLGTPLAYALGPKLDKWTFAILSTVLKVIAVAVAAYVQSIISAFYSGLRGGAMFAEGLIAVLAAQGCMDKLSKYVATDSEGKFDPKMSIVDEVIAYPLAAAGFWWQFTNSFALPWPWSIILMPLSIIEYGLKWEIFSPK